MLRIRQPLWLVLAAFVTLCAVYVWSIPPLEGSDEYEHFAYVTWLIDQRSFPTQGEAGWHSPVRQESGQPPLDGWFPTSWWPAGEWIQDEHSFALPATVPPGAYHLVAGLYNPATGDRLGGEFSLGAIEVVEGGTP